MNVATRQFAARAPVLLGLVALVALVEQATLAFFPVWALDVGTPERAASSLLAVMAIGSVALSVPVGWTADRIPAHQVIALCAGASALAVLLLPVATGRIALIGLVMFAFGGAYQGIYVVALAILGARFSGMVLVSGAAAYGAVWGVGGLIGPSALGAVTQGIGLGAFPIALAILLGASAVAALTRRTALSKASTNPS